jgi:hypothetical protein
MILIAIVNVALRLGNGAREIDTGRRMIGESLAHHEIEERVETILMTSMIIEIVGNVIEIGIVDGSIQRNTGARRKDEGIMNVILVDARDDLCLQNGKVLAKIGKIDHQRGKVLKQRHPSNLALGLRVKIRQFVVTINRGIQAVQKSLKDLGQNDHIPVKETMTRLRSCSKLKIGLLKGQNVVIGLQKKLKRR